MELCQDLAIGIFCMISHPALSTDNAPTGSIVSCSGSWVFLSPKLNHDQWHALVSCKLRKVFFSFFLLCLILSLIYSLSFILICLEVFPLIGSRATSQAPPQQWPLSSRDSRLVHADAMTGGTAVPEGVASNPFFLLVAASRASAKVVLARGQLSS